MFNHAKMQRLDQARLTNMALAALEEAAALCQMGRVERTRAPAMVLAYLAAHTSSPRWPFDSFWRALATKRDRDRWSGVNAALNAIYLAIGEKRDVATTSKFEGEARDRPS